MHQQTLHDRIDSVNVTTLFGGIPFYNIHYFHRNTYMSHDRPHIIALDLEGTLISNAMSCFPRPGLKDFLDYVRGSFTRVVLFTAVSEQRVRPILDMLVSEDDAPAWFREITVVDWSGDIKDLRFIPDCRVEEVLLVDDHKNYVHPDQLAQWVPIVAFNAPYPATDRELENVSRRLALRLGAHT